MTTYLSRAAVAAVLAATLASPAPANANELRPKKEKTYDFDGDEIDGNRIGPDDFALFVRRSSTFDSLIRIRGNFITAIIKTAEDI